MKLSEAMRLGAMTGPKCKHELVGANDSSCAIGAMLIGLGAPRAILAEYTKASDWEIRVASAMRGTWNAIVDMNNDTDMSREEIAQWVIDNGHDVELPMWGGGDNGVKEATEVAMEVVG